MEPEAPDTRGSSTEREPTDQKSAQQKSTLQNSAENKSSERESGEPEASEKESEEEGLFDARAKWFLENRRGPDGTIPWDARGKALRELAENERKGLLAARPEAIPGLFWVPLGPAPLLSGTVAWSGRVTSLAIPAGAPNTVYLGAAQGGVWKTTDGGATWVALTDSQPTLAIGAIAIDPSNPATIFAGTGESNGSCDSYFGAGILKSPDSGTSWSILGAATFANTSISRIVVHPTVPTTLWAANVGGVGGFAAATCYPRSGTYGVWKSTDGGGAWSLVLGSAQTGTSGETHDLVIDPTDPMILYAAVEGSGIWRTINGGAHWTKLGGGLPTSGLGRIDLAIDPNVASHLFTVIQSSSSGGVLGIWKTLDGGTTWTAAGSAPSGLCSTYCWYCLAIEMAPDGTLWLGGINLWRSGDAGNSWTGVSNSGLHVDQHAVAFAGGKVWSGNDGGIFVTTNNGTSWTSKTSGLALTQFYPGGSIDPASPNLVLGGAQDNGCSRFTGTQTWRQVGGGDGAFTAISFSNPNNVQYISSQNLVIQKTTNGSTFSSATSGLTDANSGSAAFIAPFVMCPGNPSVLVAGSDNVWRTNDAAVSWTSNSPESLAGGNPATAIAFAPSDSSCNTYFVGFLGGGVFRTTVGGGTGGWASIGTGLPGRVVSDLGVNPTNPNILYATFSGYGGPHVFRTTNALSASPAWTAIDSGLPDTPVLAVLVDPTNANVLYLGTDLGAFWSLDAGASWQVLMNGHPNVAVYDLVASSQAQQIVSFTHGRGAFRLTPLHGTPAGASFSDVCASGGPGSGNGIVDPGETVVMPVTLSNDGPGPLNAISGVLMTVSSDVMIQDGAATWPNLAVGASSPSNPDHFSFAVAPGAACGASLGFSLSLTYDQGSNVSAVPVIVGDPPGPSPTLVDQAFTPAIPSGWTVVDGGQFGGVARTWIGGNPCSRAIDLPFAGSWFIVDSNCAGISATQNESLITPPLNAAACSALRLGFSNQFHWNPGSMDEIADVDVSTNGGSTWVNVLRMQGADDGYPAPDTKTIDLTGPAAGQPAVTIRFHYYNGKFENYWAIDNVVVTCDVLSCHPCAPPPPGEAGVSPQLMLQKSGGSLFMTWGLSQAGCGGTDYAVYQGSLASLHLGTYDHAPFGCSTAGAPSYVAPMPAGSSAYFLVTAVSSSEEGSYGKRSSGAERPRAASACQPTANLAACP